MMKPLGWLPTCGLLIVALASDAGAQVAQTPLTVPPAPAPQAEGGLAPREIQQMIDAYVLMQAQDYLGLTDEQFPQFVTRLKSLQDTRRRHQMGHNRLIQELNRLSAPRNPYVAETLIKDQLKALHDHETRATVEIQKAMDGLDQVLNPRQQARLRVFEEQMERRKIDLLVRARLGARATPPRQIKRPPGL